MACVLVDVNSCAAGQGQPGYPDIEGCTRSYTGWMYVSLHALTEMYDLQSDDSTHGFEEYECSYSRPPLIYPYSRKTGMAIHFVPA